jgi:hypothetical protein
LLCVPSPSPPNSWLLHPRSMDGWSIAHLIDPYGGRGQLFHRSPLPSPSTSCADEQLKVAIAPSSCCRGGCFISPTAKLTASRATEARGGISDGVVWLLWLLSDDLEAIGHGFGGRSVMDGCVVREKIQYFCTYSHKKIGVGAAHFFNSSLRDLEVSFVKKYLYVICRAWSALSKTVFTLI